MPKPTIKSNMVKLLTESELDRAAVILNINDISDKLQRIAEDITKMQVTTMLITDSMRTNFGAEASDRFEKAIVSIISSTIDAIRNAKDEVSKQVNILEGKLSDEDVKTPTNDMMDDIPESTPDDEAELGTIIDDAGGDTSTPATVDAEKENTVPSTVNPSEEEGENEQDLFGGDDAASGPVDSPLGRAKKESADYSVIDMLVETYCINTDYSTDVVGRPAVSIYPLYEHMSSQTKYSISLHAALHRGIKYSVDTQSTKYVFENHSAAKMFADATTPLVNGKIEFDVVPSVIALQENNRAKSSIERYINGRYGTVSTQQLINATHLLSEAFRVNPHKAESWVNSKLNWVNKIKLKESEMDPIPGISQSDADIIWGTDSLDEKRELAAELVDHMPITQESKDNVGLSISSMSAKEIDMWVNKYLSAVGD